MEKRTRLPVFVLKDLSPLPDLRRANEMQLFDRLPAQVRHVVHDVGVIAIKEYLRGDFRRFNTTIQTETAIYSEWE